MDYLNIAINNQLNLKKFIKLFSRLNFYIISYKIN